MSHGALGIAGIISVVIGSLMLVDLPGSALSISVSTIVLVAVISAVFVFGILSFAVRAQFLKVKTGREGLIGEAGFARSRFTAGGKGKVNVHGEIWDAVSEDELNEGDEIVVAGVDRLIVKVRKKGG